MAYLIDGLQNTSNTTMMEKRLRNVDRGNKQQEHDTGGLSTPKNVNRRPLAHRSALGRSRSSTKGASEHTALDKESIEEDLRTVSAVAASRPRLAVAQNWG